VLVFVLLVVLFACGGDPWGAKEAPNVPPDEQFRTGVEAGEDVYVWNCYQGSRIVVSQFGSACFGTRAPVLERGPCGARLPGEARFDGFYRDAGAERLPPPQRWPGTTGATSSK
jgi:hypothetical protein